MAAEPERLGDLLGKALTNDARPSEQGNTPTPRAKQRDEWLFTHARRRGFMQRHVDNRDCVADCAEEKAVYERLLGLLWTGFIFVLTGRRGSGKTQIATTLACDEFDRVAPDWRNYQEMAWPLYTTARALFAEIRSTYDPNSEMNEVQVLHKFSEPCLLVIDEAQERGNTEWEDRTLTDIIDRRYGMQRDTIIICNLTRQEIAAALGTSIVSRLHECGEVIECNWPSFREKKV